MLCPALLSVPSFVLPFLPCARVPDARQEPWGAAHLLLLLLCCVCCQAVSKPCAGAALQEMALGSSSYRTFGQEIEVEFLACPDGRKAVSSAGSHSCPGG